jgi:hypothetical protein
VIRRVKSPSYTEDAIDAWEERQEREAREFVHSLVAQALKDQG